MDSASVTLDGWYWPSPMPVTSLSTLGSSARQSYSDRNLVRLYRVAPTFLGPRGDRPGDLLCPGLGSALGIFRLPVRLEVWLSRLIWCCSISAACSARYPACTPCWNSPALKARRSCGGAGWHAAGSVA